MRLSIMAVRDVNGLAYVWLWASCVLILGTSSLEGATSSSPASGSTATPPAAGVLIHFKNNLKPVTAKDVLSSWDARRPVCEWDYVLCDAAGNVTELYLSFKGLQGTIHEYLGLIPSLQVLHLSGNNFTGGIPNSLGLLRDLEQLHLAGNQLLGPIPTRVTSLRKLRQLSVFSNPGLCGAPLSAALVQRLVGGIYETGLNRPCPEALAPSDAVPQDASAGAQPAATAASGGPSAAPTASASSSPVDPVTAYRAALVANPTAVPWDAIVSWPTRALLPPGTVPPMCSLALAQTDVPTALALDGGVGQQQAGLAVLSGGGQRRLLAPVTPPVVFTEVNTFRQPPDNALPIMADVLSRVRPRKLDTCSSADLVCSADGNAKYHLGFKEGSLGTCAIVGLGPNLLKSKLGREIDAHDTVIRFGGAPVQGYEPYVGSRTTISFLRELLQRSTGGSAPTPPDKSGEEARLPRVGTDVWTRSESKVQVPEAFYLSHAFHEDREYLLPPSHRGKPYLPLHALSDNIQLHTTQLYGLLQDYITLVSARAQRERTVSPSKGMELILAVLHSALCTRVDLYGITQDGMGHYFEGVSSTGNRDARSGFSYRSVAGLEYYVYQLAMANGLLCMRD
eukprot:jgi/Mesvir1/21134/Mv08887-RA.1